MSMFLENLVDLTCVFFLIGCCEAPTVTKSFVAGQALQDLVVTKDILGFYLFLLEELVSGVKRVVIYIFISDFTLSLDYLSEISDTEMKLQWLMSHRHFF